MQLIVITPEHDIKDETEIVNSLFNNGLQRLHLRKPLSTADAHREYLAKVDKRYHSRIVLNDFFELVNEFGLGGIHLNSFARNNSSMWEYIPPIPSAFISTSFHSWQEIEDNNFQYRYVFISPVFDSISKSGYKGDIVISGITAAKQKLAARNKYFPKILGLGGVGVDQIPLLHSHGFDGAAMLGAIWMTEDPVKTFIEARNAAKAL